MKKIVRIIILILMCYAIYFFYQNVIKDTKQEEIIQEEYLNEIINGDKLDEEQLKLITDFFNTYYKSIRYLKEYDMTMYFTKDSKYALINQTAMQLLIESRRLKPNDLSMKDVYYDIEITKVKGTDEVSISVLESNVIRFSFMSDIESKSYDIENNFVIVKENDVWKISKYDKTQDFYVMITDEYTSGGKEKLDRIKNSYLTTIKKKIDANAKDYQSYMTNNLVPKTCDNAYDRDKALEYAIKYAHTRNYKWDEYESNCQNYVSQVVYSGGVVMDYYGSDDDSLQWKYYDGIYNKKEEPKGFVDTWTYVPTFYLYAKNNTGTGLCASVDVNIYYAEPGDVIHVGSVDYERHAVVVVGNYKKDGKVVDILINSNTNDVENYPISAYTYPYASLIKIYGWND